MLPISEHDPVNRSGRRALSRRTFSWGRVGCVVQWPTVYWQETLRRRSAFATASRGFQLLAWNSESIHSRGVITRAQLGGPRCSARSPVIRIADRSVESSRQR